MVILVVVIFLLPAVALAQSSYVLKSSTFGAAGAPGASDNFHSNGTMGHSTPIGTGSTSNHTLYAGYWAQVWPSIPTAALAPIAYRDELFQNYPNPFNPTTTVEYSVARTNLVEIVIYNVRGQQVKTLVSEDKSPGRYKAQWNGRNDTGSQVASGVYFYRLTIGSYSSVKKLVLLK
jgi:hypothetical protein